MNVRRALALAVTGIGCVSVYLAVIGGFGAPGTKIQAGALRELTRASVAPFDIEAVGAMSAEGELLTDPESGAAEIPRRDTERMVDAVVRGQASGSAESVRAENEVSARLDFPVDASIRGGYVPERSTRRIEVGDPKNSAERGLDRGDCVECESKILGEPLNADWKSGARNLGRLSSIPIIVGTPVDASIPAELLAQ